MKKIVHAFQLFDHNRKDKINLKKLTHIAKKLCVNLLNEELEVMICEFDFDENDAIDEERFIMIFH